MLKKKTTTRKPTKFLDCITQNHKNKVEWQILGVFYLDMLHLGDLLISKKRVK